MSFILWKKNPCELFGQSSRLPGAAAAGPGPGSQFESRGSMQMRRRPEHTTSAPVLHPESRRPQGICGTALPGCDWHLFFTSDFLMFR